jgi:hypothetical protein
MIAGEDAYPANRAWTPAARRIVPRSPAGVQTDKDHSAVMPSARLRNVVLGLTALLLLLSLGSVLSPPAARFAFVVSTIVLGVGLILGCVWYLLAQQQDH